MSSNRNRTALIFQQRCTLANDRFGKYSRRNERCIAPPSPTIYLTRSWMISWWTWWRFRSGHIKRGVGLLEVFSTPLNISGKAWEDFFLCLSKKKWSCQTLQWLLRSSRRGGDDPLGRPPRNTSPRPSCHT